MTPFYSVAICSHNGARTISECLTAIFNQTVPADQFEILVVDDGSTDQLGQLVMSAFDGRKNCHYIRFEQNRGLGAARNAAWQNARGEIVFFIDDDAIADADWLQRLASSYQVGVAGVGGLPRPVKHTTFSTYEMGIQCVNYGAHAERLDGAGGNNMSFRRSALAEIGGFDERFVAVADDADINRRMTQSGRRLIVRPDVTVRHYMPDTYRQFWRKKIGRGRGSFRFRVKYGLPHSKIRCVIRVAYFAIWLPLHFKMAYRLSNCLGNRNQFIQFAILHWMDRVAGAYGELLETESAKCSHYC